MSFSHHRRTQSELHVRIPDEFDLDLDMDVDLDVDSFDFKNSIHNNETVISSSSSSVAAESLSMPVSDHQLPPFSPASATVPPIVDISKTTVRPGHRRSNSADGTSSSSLLLEGIEAKKAMSPDKLAELWTVDPKRAKRILANRKSAARSKERRACYVVELERKIQVLQTEATTLSAQLNLFQRDTTGLTTENTELRLRLQAMEQQAKLCDALNEALKKEVDRLKIATGEMVTRPNSNSLAMHRPSYSQAPFFSFQSQHFAGELHTMQMPPLHPLSPNMSSPRPLIDVTTPYNLSNMLPSDHVPVGQFQVLDISHPIPHVLIHDGPSISVNKINDAF